MKELLIEDELWRQIEPLLPVPKPRRLRHPGRKPLDDRKALSGILFVLKNGLTWNDLPQDLGYGSGVGCWGRLRDWHQAGVWERLRAVLLVGWPGADKIDWSRASLRTIAPAVSPGGGVVS